MVSAGWATLDIIPSMKGVRSSIERQAAGDMAAAGRTSGRRFGDAAGREAGTSFKSRMSGALKGFAPFAGLAAGAGVTALFTDAIDEASALSESANKLNVIFGDAADTVNEFADAASEGLGQSDLQARNAAASFGVYGKAAGLAGGELAAFSTELTALASDMASFYDAESVQQVIDALGSGLRGEAEPLRQFGVLLDDATLKAEAMRQGIIETTKDALTPQQKVLAAHAVIMEQTAIAQGDFARTSDGLANSSRDLAADWADMKAQLGEELLPAAQAFVGFAKDDMLPALGEAGGLARDAVEAFSDLPAPVQASAAAFVALRLAAATGMTAAAGSGIASLGSAVEGTRIRAMLARDEFRLLRDGIMEFNGNVGRVVAPVGRLTAGMSALRTAAQGAGGALRSGLSGAMGILGGPWGLALIGATAAVTHFWQENQEAKARIDAMTEALDEQTGALTENNRELAFKALQESGAVESAREFGIGLDLLTDAAMGSEYAISRVNDMIQRQIDAQPAVVAGASNQAQAYQNLLDSADDLRGAIGGQNDEIAAARQRFRDHAEAMGESAEATDEAADAMGGYATQLREARDELIRLHNEENDRRLSRVQDRRDQLALIEMQKAANEEARKGARTLDEQTKAGQENWNMLLDLADQWNNSSSAVTDAKGAYGAMRREFIETATEMGATAERAENLADKYLKIPDHKKTRITTPGMDRALDDIERLKSLLEGARDLSIDLNAARFDDPRLKSPPGFASGGMIGGYGTGTSDSNLIWASKGEFMQRKAAVDYYGVEFMRRLNALQVPKLPGYAQGGLIRGGGGRPTAGGNTFHVTVVADDPWKMKRSLEHMALAGALGGADFT